MGFWDGSGISWTICKQSAPRSRQITTPTPHHSIFTGRCSSLPSNGIIALKPFSAYSAYKLTYIDIIINIATDRQFPSSWHCVVPRCSVEMSKANITQRTITQMPEIVRMLIQHTKRRGVAGFL